MHTDIRQDKETGRWEWEVSTYSSGNLILIPVDYGCSATYKEAEQDAEKAKNAYLHWLGVRNF